jgi:DNA-binding MurR/RpiR family transcriptional regulator
MPGTCALRIPAPKGLGPAEAKAAEYLERHQEDAAFFSIGSLAKAAGVSEATLSRLVRKLGFARFAEYQDGLQRRVRERLTPRAKTSKTLGRDADRTYSLGISIRAEAERLAGMADLVDEAAFEGAARAIAGARRVFIAGLGVSRGICSFLAFRLTRFGLRAEELLDPGSLERAIGIGRGDVAMAVGFVRMHAETAAFLEWSSGRGARTIAITEGPSTPLGRRAEIVLAAPRGPVAELGSLALPMIVADALATRAARLGKERAEAAMRDLELMDGIYRNALALSLSQAAPQRRGGSGA